MESPVAEPDWAEGQQAVVDGRWDDARPLLESVIVNASDGSALRARALTALSDALWWTGKADRSIATRLEAYQAWRDAGAEDEAVEVAMWLAREYAAVGNATASAGWLARAETLAGDRPAVDGWLALTRAGLASDPVVQESEARHALGVARLAKDGDLEALALGRLGLALISRGLLDEGLARFDEAMAASTGGDSGLNTLALLCCDLARATELSGEVERFARWNDVVMKTTVRSGHPDLVAFCMTCCAEVFTAVGDWSSAEAFLRQAIDDLGKAGHTARCIAPTAKLAELLIFQGRVEEARAIVDQDSSDMTLMARARIALHEGDPALAITLTRRHRRRSGGDSLITVPAMCLQVEGYVMAGDLQAADDMADRLAALADETGNRRTAGRAATARARVLAARGFPEPAVAALEAGLDILTAVAPLAIETSEAHLDLARLHVEGAPDVSHAEAKAALLGFEAAGATHGADAAAALLRSLGDRSRVGAKGAGVLTDREREVLRLVAQGLTNAEIAERLYISTKTAGNHVSNILTKLGMRSRVEAAAYAAINPF